MTLEKYGSMDDNPDQMEIPGLKEKALNPAQKSALKALQLLHKIRVENKATRKELKETEDAALEKALEAIDALGQQVGKVGPATYEAQIIRKLKLKLLKELKQS